MADNQKAVFIRFNMDDDTDRVLYQKLVSEAGSSASLAAYSKKLLEEHFALSITIADRQEFHKEILSAVREEMQEQGMKLVGALLAGIGTVDIRTAQVKTEDNEAGLPDRCEELPDELSSVLELIR
jgi:hypothetical protein